MALVINDRVKETSTTTGTGTFTLIGAVTGFETFSSAIGNTNTTYYSIANENGEFEVGLGTVGAGTLARTTILSSSNSDAAVNFSSGTKNVFCTLPASKAVILDSSDNIVANNGSNLTNLNADNLASGTVPDARFPATLPAANGSALTDLNATNLASGTVPDARFPATLPAVSGANLTNLDASDLASGTVPDARLSSSVATLTGIQTLTNKTINASQLVNGSITVGKMGANSVDSDQYVDGSIDTIHIADDQITLAKMAPGTDGNIISYDTSGNPVAVATGSAGQILTSAGAGAVPTFADPAAAGTDWQTVKTTGFTAVAGEGYFINTTSGAFTMTLPASPSIGDEVSFIDYAGTFDSNALTIGRNSQPIQGAAADLTVSVERAANTLVYTDGTQGWLLTSK
jgi:hypothetical protein